jgi:hypothetical protein
VKVSIFWVFSTVAFALAMVAHIGEHLAVTAILAVAGMLCSIAAMVWEKR